MNNGCHRARLIAAAVIGSILFLAACGGQHTNPLPTHSNSASGGYANGAPGNSVSVFADNSDELATRIDAAMKAGLHPKFIQVAAGKRSYLFPVYAQVLRSQRALIVRAYGRIYVYRLNSTHVRYTTQLVQPSRLPQVTATLIDSDIAAGKQPGQFNLNSKAKLKICPDCTELLLYQPQVLKLASAWNGKLDFWQTDPDYVPWAPTSSAPPDRRTMCTVGGSTIACVYSHCSNCYTSTGYTPNDNTTTGGGSVASNPTPTPKPCYQTGNSSVDNVVNNDKTGNDKKALTALSNLGEMPNVVPTTLPYPTAAKFDHGTLYWDQNAVNASGQDPAQILWHELDHAYNYYHGFSMPPGGSVTVTIGGYTVTYNLTTSSGVDAYEHLLTHNDLYGAFGTDGTGAAWQMFGYGNSSGVTVKQGTNTVTGDANLQSAGNANRNTNVATTAKPATSFNGAIANSGGACSGTTATAARRAALVPRYGGYGGSSVYSTPPPTPQPAATMAPYVWSGEIYH